MPQWMSRLAKQAFYNAITTATEGNTPTLLWKEPIKIATQMEMTIVDAQQRVGTPRRLVKVILRARPKFQGRWYLNVTKCDISLLLNVTLYYQMSHSVIKFHIPVIP
jgi:hypothetical protein